MLCHGEFLSVWCLINTKARVVGFFSLERNIILPSTGLSFQNSLIVEII